MTIAVKISSNLNNIGDVYTWYNTQWWNVDNNLTLVGIMSALDSYIVRKVATNSHSELWM